MQIRTIPKDTYPWWSCRINHKEYRYPSGATMSVPDAVAALIDGINAADRQPEQAYIPHLPAITPADEGKVLKVVGGKWVLEEGGSGTAHDAYYVPFTITVENNVAKAATTATLADVLEAYNDNRAIMAVASLPWMDVTVIIPLVCLYPIATPETATFTGVMDLATAGETPDPSLFQITMSSSKAEVSMFGLMPGGD